MRYLQSEFTGSYKNIQKEVRIPKGAGTESATRCRKGNAPLRGKRKRDPSHLDIEKDIYTLVELCLHLLLELEHAKRRVD
jgi:hypothetical protein